MLTRLRKKYQSKVDEVANYFNTLFHQKDQEYSFELTFNPDRISFGISLGDKALNYDAQSTGFQYFFNMFFNYFYNRTIVPGDVLIMDEPGTHLTVEGQEHCD